MADIALNDDIVYVIAKYLNDKDFMYTLSSFNKSDKINKRRKKILSKRSVLILNEHLIYMGYEPRARYLLKEYHLYSHKKFKKNTKNMRFNKLVANHRNPYFELLDDIKGHLLKSTTSLNPFGYPDFNDYYENYNHHLAVKHVFYPEKSILRTPLDEVKKHFNDMEGEIEYSNKICPIYRVDHWTCGLLDQKCRTAKALIY